MEIYDIGELLPVSPRLLHIFYVALIFVSPLLGDCNATKNYPKMTFTWLEVGIVQGLSKWLDSGPQIWNIPEILISRHFVTKPDASLQSPAGVKIFVGCGFLGFHNPNPNRNPRNLGLLFAKITKKLENWRKLSSVGPTRPEFLGLGL